MTENHQEQGIITHTSVSRFPHEVPGGGDLSGFEIAVIGIVAVLTILALIIIIVGCWNHRRFGAEDR